MTESEHRCSEVLGERFQLYRVFNFSRRPRVYVLMLTWKDSLKPGDINLFFQSFFIMPPGGFRNDEMPPADPPDARLPPPWTPAPLQRRVNLAVPNGFEGLLAHWSFDEGEGNRAAGEASWARILAFLTEHVGGA